MLSFICRLAADFERAPGFRPHVLYINSSHLRRMRDDFADPSMTSIRRLLGMEVLVSVDAVHPHVGWTQAASRVAV